MACYCLNVLPLQGQELVIGHVGDSRAVLGTRDKNNSLTAVQLTVDLKPNLPSNYFHSFFFKLLIRYKHRHPFFSVVLNMSIAIVYEIHSLFANKQVLFI